MSHRKEIDDRSLQITQYITNYMYEDVGRKCQFWDIKRDINLYDYFITGDISDHDDKHKAKTSVTFSAAQLVVHDKVLCDAAREKKLTYWYDHNAWRGAMRCSAGKNMENQTFL